VSRRQRRAGRRTTHTRTPAVRQDAGRVPLSPPRAAWRAAAPAHSCSQQLLAAGTGRSGGLGTRLGPACLLRQRSLEETSSLLPLLPGSPCAWPRSCHPLSCMTHLLTRKSLSELTHASLPRLAVPCVCCHPHLSLLPGPTSNRWKVAVGHWGPEQRRWHTAAWDRVYRGIGGQRTGVLGIPCNGHLLPFVASLGAPLDTRPHCWGHRNVAFLPTRTLHPPMASSLLLWQRVQLIPTPGSHPHLSPQQPSVPSRPGQQEATDLPQHPG